MRVVQDGYARSLFAERLNAADARTTYTICTEPDDLKAAEGIVFSCIIGGLLLWPALIGMGCLAWHML